MDAWLIRLFRHMAWADGKVLDALERLPEPPATALGLLAHVVAAEAIWLARIEGRDPAPLVPWTPLSLDECRRMSGDSLPAFEALTASASGARLAEAVPYRTTRGEPFETPLGDILLHVAVHGAHHRGQIAAQMRAHGLDAPSMDLIFFSRAFPAGTDGR